MRNYSLDRSALLASVRATLQAGVTAVSVDQLFASPPPVAQRVINALSIRSGERVLEPSAGTGALLRAMGASLSEAHVVAVEISEPLAEQLRRTYAPRVEVICADFLNCRPNGDDWREGLCIIGLFQKIAMNPPFQGMRDVAHVTHALRFLPPGEGRITAVMVNDGQSFRPELTGEAGHGRRADKVAELRALVEAEGRSMTVEELPECSFQPQGTGVRTALVTIE